MESDSAFRQITLVLVHYGLELDTKKSTEARTLCTSSLFPVYSGKRYKAWNVLKEKEWKIGKKVKGARISISC